MISQQWMVRALAALAVAGTLAGCGGGGGGGLGVTPPGNGDVLPAAALESAEAFLIWMKGEATARDNDGAEPLSLGAAMPPEADLDEPVALR